jgi:hypothetical protein
VVLSREAVLLRAPDARWRELFERADVMTEGGARDEPSGRVWYGSTSAILRAEGAAPALLAELAGRDPHVRLRAVRMAHREAQLRAPGLLGRFACEIRVSVDSRGVRIDVDVQAPLIERRARARTGP